jgi:hypothetical protein
MKNSVANDLSDGFLRNVVSGPKVNAAFAGFVMGMKHSRTKS